MFPWYSGTSADLLKTLFDLMVSVKVFLGRFDMRTMQVATASEWVAPDPTPQDGDGFTFEHLAEGRELWFDFCADTEETYRTRLFSLYEAALPPPPHVHKGHLVVNKPDVGRGLLCHKATALRRYEGPSSFAIPGNHDWIDGLETFSRHILHRGWLGGWLLPQEKSYWALRLPAGWWVFGIDLALVDDIDTCQYKYFARVAETRMAPTDQAILIMHCPRWLVDWFWGTDTANNLRHLVRGPLRGRARLAVAGDLHFYMRHSFQPYDAPGASSSLVPSAASTPAGGSPVGGSPGSSRAPTPRPDASAPAGVSPTAGFGRPGASSGLRGRSPDPSCPPGGEYRCAAAYPSAQQSESIGRRNLHMFRNMNTRFDVIGGALYYLLVVSVLPRCRHLAAVLEAPDWGTGLSLLLGAAADTVSDIFLESYVSLLALLCMAALALGFAATGGIGAKGDATAADRQRPEFKGRGLAVRARLGGFTTRFLFASLHCAAHVCCAVFLLLLLELGIETVIRHEQLGREGYHSLYKWYRQYEAAHFPDPADMRGAAERWTLGLYPGAIKWAMAAFDAPEAIAVSRDLLCAGRELNRLQALGYYGGVLAYYWLLATPTVALVFGAYLYICVNWFGVHYDEAFSSLQVPDHKGFLRMHITPAGDLEIFSLGLDTVPRAWREDPAWRAPGGGGDAGVPGWRARHPSRWVPVEVRGGYTLRGTPPEAALKVVDYLHVPRQRPVIV
ncbi:hypothetical protein F751_3196 [Auxenochlorella protothecoides]|uniref:Calcineurin-like phosphoesterase domain-containing protein n=1 Tax=Auxenochlorella protothecoides TaxID=3075 RepID=A0A087SFH4_AUXPR|nr:hypothetical protein F751_3196 [Auxenochlorella protothecoides]KFM24478.1 hypothetical protein F751_3196 [Auxenochlorella protothecoides]